jgi:hypothetical protein
VQSGEASSYELTPEFIDPSCLQGHNRYLMLDDDAYTDSFYACVDQARAKL